VDRYIMINGLFEMNREKMRGKGNFSFWN